MEGKNGADAFSSVVELAGSAADDGQQNGDDLLDAEGTESGQSDDAIEGISAGLEFLDEERQKLFGDDGALAVAEVAQNGNGEALGGRETRSTDCVQQIGNGDHSSLLQSLGRLDWAGFQQILSFKKYNVIDLKLNLNYARKLM